MGTKSTIEKDKIEKCQTKVCLSSISYDEFIYFQFRLANIFSFIDEIQLRGRIHEIQLRCLRNSISSTKFNFVDEIQLRDLHFHFRL